MRPDRLSPASLERALLSATPILAIPVLAVPALAVPVLAIPILGSSVLAAPALAASDDAWEAFRRQVEVNCRALTDRPETAEVTVHPFGSEGHGVALVRLPGDAGAGDAGAGEVMVCIMDKITGRTEITPPFAAGVP